MATEVFSEHRVVGLADWKAKGKTGGSASNSGRKERARAEEGLSLDALFPRCETASADRGPVSIGQEAERAKQRALERLTTNLS